MKLALSIIAILLSSAASAAATPDLSAREFVPTTTVNGTDPDSIAAIAAYNDILSAVAQSPKDTLELDIEDRDLEARCKCGYNVCCKKVKKKCHYSVKNCYPTCGQIPGTGALGCVLGCLTACGSD